MENDLSRRYIERLPAIQSWIQETLRVSAKARRTINSFVFHRIPEYFSEEILNTAGVVSIDRLPVPPLTALGLTEFAGFESQQIAAVTYMNTYFVQPDHIYDESLHFHELVHVVQWKTIGPESFLMLYAQGLAKYGYRESPLEQMAYRYQVIFDEGIQCYRVEGAVAEETLGLARTFI